MGARAGTGGIPKRSGQCSNATRHLASQGAPVGRGGAYDERQTCDCRGKTSEFAATTQGLDAGNTGREAVVGRDHRQDLTTAKFSAARLTTASKKNKGEPAGTGGTGSA
jgi:hypothetical protein